MTPAVTVLEEELDKRVRGRRAAPALEETEDLDLELGDDRGEDDDLDDELEELPPAPPELKPDTTPDVPLLRSKHYQPKSPTREKPSGTSSWVGKPREGFTSTMEERAPEMGKTREGRSIKGTTFGW